jgi:glycosyltransferase involved in cell wall biosynthesis
MKISFASMAFRGTWIAPSRYTHSEMIRRGIPESRVEILHNPATFATLARSSTRESRRRIVYVGRLARNKGVDLLISAMANLPDSVELYVVGAGPEADSLSEMARRVPYSQRIHLVGWKEPAEVRAIMSEAACLVVPSLWPEPFGLVVLEAFSLGCPVVAADTGGLRDLVIPGRTGYLFPPGSATGLAEQIRLCLHQPEIAEAMAISGQKMAEREFRLDMHVNRLGLIYRRQGARA